jgi:hypothetical protein
VKWEKLLIVMEKLRRIARYVKMESSVERPHFWTRTTCRTVKIVHLDRLPPKTDLTALDALPENMSLVPHALPALPENTRHLVLRHVVLAPLESLVLLAPAPAYLARLASTLLPRDKARVSSVVLARLAIPQVLAVMPVMLANTTLIQPLAVAVAQLGTSAQQEHPNARFALEASMPILIKPFVSTVQVVATRLQEKSCAVLVTLVHGPVLELSPVPTVSLVNIVRPVRVHAVLVRAVRPLLPVRGLVLIVAKASTEATDYASTALLESTRTK